MTHVVWALGLPTYGQYNALAPQYFTRLHSLLAPHGAPTDRIHFAALVRQVQNEQDTAWQCAYTWRAPNHFPHQRGDVQLLVNPPAARATGALHMRRALAAARQLGVRVRWIKAATTNQPKESP
jgi:hypothetical protein